MTTAADVLRYVHHNLRVPTEEQVADFAARTLDTLVAAGAGPDSAARASAELAAATREFADALRTTQPAAARLMRATNAVNELMEPTERN